MELPQNVRFPDKETAFAFVVMVRKAYLAEVARKPLTEIARRYIEDQARSLRARTAAAVTAMHDLQSEKWALLLMARECGVTEATHYVDDTDLGKAIDELLEFKYGDHPFFSESCLYELIGKEDARTVLSMLKRLISVVAPEKGIEL